MEQNELGSGVQLRTGVSTVRMVKDLQLNHNHPVESCPDFASENGQNWWLVVQIVMPSFAAINFSDKGKLGLSLAFKRSGSFFSIDPGYFKALYYWSVLVL